MSDLGDRLQPPCGKCGSEWSRGHLCARTPRVAGSIDDLRVGQVVVLNRSLGRRIGTVRSVGSGGAMLQLDGDDIRSQSAFAFDVGKWVILSDPPPTPVTVPAELIDALAEALLHLEGRCTCAMCVPARAHRAAVRDGADQ